MRQFRTNWDARKSDASRYPIYRDRANGTIEHFTYSDGAKVTLARSYAEHEVNAGLARYVDCK